MITIVRVSLALTFLLFSFAASPNAGARTTPRPLRVSFEFSTRMDAQENPHTRVFLRVNNRRTLVLTADEGFYSLKRSQFAQSRVPRHALAACSGWWAGAGDNLYVVRRGTHLDVYQQELDEQAPPSHYHRIKSVLLAPRRR